MNDLLTRQLIRIRDLRTPRVAAVELAALVEEIWACSAVDCAVDAAAAEQGFIGCVDDGVGLELGDVGADEGDSVVEARGCG